MKNVLQGRAVMAASTTATGVRTNLTLNLATERSLVASTKCYFSGVARA